MIRADARVNSIDQKFTVFYNGIINIYIGWNGF